MKHRVKGSSFFQFSRVKNTLTRLIHRAKPYLYLEISGKLMLITNSQNGVKQDMFLIMDWYNLCTQRLGRVHRFYDVINVTIPHSTSAFQGGNVGEHWSICRCALLGCTFLMARFPNLILIPRRNTQHFFNRRCSSPEVFQNEVVNRKCQAAIWFSVKSYK